jgi:hypothetical protein
MAQRLSGANQPTGSGSPWAALLSNAPLVLGAILIAFVLLVPKGLVPTLGDWGQALLRPRVRERIADAAPMPVGEE